MKLQQKIEVDGNEVVNHYIMPQASSTYKLDIKPENVRIQVYSDTKKEWIPFKGDKIKFIWEG